MLKQFYFTIVLEMFGLKKKQRLHIEHSYPLRKLIVYKQEVIKELSRDG